MAEFDGIRARMYEEALEEYPVARELDIKAMKKLLKPEKGEKILGFGEGNGYFCKTIAESVGSEGEYCISDPSEDQLKNLKKKLNLPQIKILVAGAEDLKVEKNYFDKVWSFGAFHHCMSKSKAMRNVYDSLKFGGKAVVCDVFQGSELAKHFDVQVAKYCITGHEVEFMSEEFAKKICLDVGFKLENIEIIDLPQKWVFDSKYDLGKFIYKLHAMTKIPGNEDERIKEVIRGCEEILGIKKIKGKYALNWPMKCLIAKK